MQTGSERTFTPLRVVLGFVIMLVPSWLFLLNHRRSEEQAQVRARAIYVAQLEAVASLYGCITFEGTNAEDLESILCLEKAQTWTGSRSITFPESH